jgi:uncharacterized RDD family membrane protein YckC
MASLIDLLFASLITAIIVLPLRAIFSHRFNGDLGPFILLCYAVYATALSARNGRTPGQWLFELEVVDAASGKKPTLGRTALRVGIPVALPVFGQLVEYLVPHRLDALTDILVVGGCALAPIAMVWATLRSLNKQTLWDRASHTLVRYRTRRTNAI